MKISTTQFNLFQGNGGSFSGFKRFLPVSGNNALKDGSDNDHDQLSFAELLKAELGAKEVRFPENTGQPEPVTAEYSVEKRAIQFLNEFWA